MFKYHTFLGIQPYFDLQARSEVAFKICSNINKHAPALFIFANRRYWPSMDRASTQTLMYQRSQMKQQQIEAVCLPAKMASSLFCLSTITTKKHWFSTQQKYNNILNILCFHYTYQALSTTHLFFFAPYAEHSKLAPGRMGPRDVVIYNHAFQSTY